MDVDVVIVSYNSRTELRDSVAPLAAIQGVNVIVCDSASTDGSLETISDLPIQTVPLGVNRGFAYGCNVGWRAGSAPFVLFLNPDAHITEEALEALVDAADSDDRIGCVGPRIVGSDGVLHYSQRRFARLRSTYARALFLHRVFPGADWSDELVRGADAYAERRQVEWLSGAALLLRREALDRLGGLDERFFLYREDMDLCRRLDAAGYVVVYEPAATVEHAGGASAPREQLYGVLARARVLYARKHERRLVAALERFGVALEAATHLLVAKGGIGARRGHARALAATLRQPS